jgi:acyl-CoA ligase (AMP-forming) (exosortase A-associated)
MSSNMLLHGLFDATAARAAERAALRHQERTYTYGELGERGERVASALERLGLRRGERVVSCLPNRPEVIDLALACSRLGLIFVPVSPLLKSRQLGHVLRDSGARLLVASATIAASAATAWPDCAALELRVACESPSGDSVAPKGAIPYQDLLASASSRRAESAGGDRDAAMILYTSGSTGWPKGVVVSHRNLVSGAQCVAQYLANVADDRILAALPLSFDYGFSQVSTAFSVGACVVLTNFSTAAALLQELNGKDITGLAGVPTMWAHLAATEWPPDAGASLRYITNSGGALVPAVLRKLQARLPKAKVYSMYGLTEAFRSTYLHPEQLAQRPTSIGKAVPSQEVMVLRPDGARCDPDELGELVHRGSFVTLGYWNDAELTRQRFRPVQSNSSLQEELVVWSGDLARTDAEGYIYFVGRRDGMIKTSGYRVSPTEIEEVALEVPGLVEAVAVGLPDDVLGQKIGLALMGEASDKKNLVEAVRQHCRVHLPAFMAPAQICLLAAIPRNVNGKPDRAAVQAYLVEQSGA